MNSTKERILIVTDTPVLNTGLGRICRELTFRLSLDYDVAVGGWHHMPLRYNLPFYIYPIRKGGSGEPEQLNLVLNDFNPDILLCVGDIWDFFYVGNVLNGYRDSGRKIKSLLWVTVDGEWLSDMWEDTIRSFDSVCSFSKFGKNELKQCIATRDFPIIYPGVNQKDFYSYKEDYNWGEKSFVDVKNTFITLMVGQNCDRKNIPASLEAFSEFAKDKDNVLFFGLTDPREVGGQDLIRIVKKLGVHKKIAFAKDVNPRSGVDDKKLNYLYNMSEVLLNTAVGEGLGLPLIECMATHAVPFSTNYAAGAEVVGDRGRLIDVVAKVYGEYHVKRAFVSIDSIIDNLNDLYNDWMTSERNLIKSYNKHCHQFVNTLSWDNTIKQLCEEFKNIDNQSKLRSWVKERVEIEHLQLMMVVPSWGKNCGIAEYSKQLSEEFEKNGNNIIIAPTNNIDTIVNAAQEKGCNAICIQHEYSFFPNRFEFENLLRRLKDNHIKTIIELHSFSPLQYYNDMVLEVADSIIVHCNLFKEKLLHGSKYDNIHVIPLFCKNRVDYDLQPVKQELCILERTPIIGSFGFMREQKGYKEIILAVKELSKKYPKILLLLVAPHHEFGSDSYEEEFLKFVEDKDATDNIVIIREYMEEEKLLKILACVDIFVLNYKASPAGGGNSAAVKTLMRVQRPIITTDTIYFADFENNEVMKVPDLNVKNMIESIEILNNDYLLRKQYVDSANKFLYDNSIERLIERHLDAYRR